MTAGWKHSIACAVHDGAPCSCREDAAGPLAPLFAQVREALKVWDDGSRARLTGVWASYAEADLILCADALAALSAIERHVQDMETALRDAEVGFNDLSLILEADGDDWEILDRAYRRACDEWRHVRGALPAREEGANDE